MDSAVGGELDRGSGGVVRLAGRKEERGAGRIRAAARSGDPIGFSTIHAANTTAPTPAIV